MNKEALDALRLSIARWEVIARQPGGINVALEAEDCALCDLFRPTFTDEGRDCKGCPVAASTGRSFCLETPYQEVIFAKSKNDEAAFRAAAKKEVDFLRGLLPKTEKE